MTEVFVGSGLLPRLPGLLKARVPRRRVSIVVDAGLVAAGRRLARAFTAQGWKAPMAPLPAGEGAKSLRSLAKLYDFLLKTGHERRDPVLALGGGTVGDAAGFAAATFMRGVPLVQVPTTLLAQSDSCLGGKTGVNLPGAKNAVGAFHQPLLVAADVDFLATLSERDFRSGLAEVVKYGLVLDAAFARALARRWDGLVARRPAELAWAVERSLRLKASVVAQDEHDLTGRRELLNFGHTLGHALEAAGGFSRFTHGEAVAFGMRAAALLSLARGGLADGPDSRLLWDLLGRLPAVRVPASVRARELVASLSRDKKARGGKPVFVLLKGLARPERCGSVGEAELFRALGALGVRR